MLKSIIIGCMLTTILILSSCSKTNNSAPKLIFKYKMDSTQARLDNFGQPSTMPSGHAGQNPSFHVMGIHYIEMARTMWDSLGRGEVLYKTPTTTAGGAAAIDFTQEAKGNDGDVIYSVPLSQVTPGTYQYLRVSLAYQNYDVKFHWDTAFTYAGYPITINQDFVTTVASFIGVNTYLTNYLIKTQTINVNGNRVQGYGGAETTISLPQYGGFTHTYTSEWQSPGTTVVNPLFATSPIPPGSCVETAAFTPGNLTITGHETQDIVVTVSLSTNKSFEWIDNNGNGKWDGMSGEIVTDMGVRGILPIIGH